MPKIYCDFATGAASFTSCQGEGDSEVALRLFTQTGCRSRTSGWCCARCRTPRFRRRSIVRHIPLRRVRSTVRCGILPLMVQQWAWVQSRGGDAVVAGDVDDVAVGVGGEPGEVAGVVVAEPARAWVLTACGNVERFHLGDLVGGGCGASNALAGSVVNCVGKAWMATRTVFPPAGSTALCMPSSFILPSRGCHARSGRVRPRRGSSASIVCFQRFSRLRRGPSTKDSSRRTGPCGSGGCSQGTPHLQRGYPPRS